jgi:hypothetical protein
MKRVHIISTIALLSVLFFSSCYKISHNHIMKGKWYVNSFEVNGGSTNLMEGVLPNYADGDGQYIVYMLDNGLMRGEYYADDSLVYFRTGIWEMPSSDSVYFEIDKFIKGTFKIEPAKNKGKAFIMSTASNYIEFFNIGEVETVMRISRGEYVDPELTK